MLDGRPLDLAINLDVPREIVLDRLAGRRVCENCQRVYHVNMPPTSNWTCDTCGGQVVQRDDDTEEAIDRRLELYERGDGADHRLLPRAGACSRWSTASARATTCSSASSNGRRPRSGTTARRPVVLRKTPPQIAHDAQGRAASSPRCTRRARGRPSPARPPPISTRAAREVLDRRGARSNFLGYHGFPAVACISPNEVIVHGIPGDRVLDDGDIVSIDCGAIIEGWHADAAITVPVGDDRRGVAAPDRRHPGRRSTPRIEQARSGNRLGDIGAAVRGRRHGGRVRGGAGVRRPRHRHRDARGARRAQLRHRRAGACG